MSSTPTTASETGGWLPVLGSLGFGALCLVAANIGVLVLYFAYELSLFQLVFVFWCECLWVGFLSALKLVVASVIGSPYENGWASVSRGAALFMSIIVIAFAGGTFLSLLGMTLMMFLAAIETLPQSLNADDGLEVVTVGLGVSMLLLASHSISFVINFLLAGEFRAARVLDLAVLPFKRCLALLVAMITSFAVIAFVPILANTAGFAAVVIVLKLLWDLRLHLKERHAFGIMRPSQ